MRVWLDMNNSPHPLLLRPIAERFRRKGHEVLVTARDTAMTRELTLARWPDAEIIGSPADASRWQKTTLIVQRVHALRNWAKGRELDLALSHNSYAQILAARSLGIRTVTAMDYEYQPASHLAFRAADRVVIPEVFPGPSHDGRAVQRVRHAATRGSRRNLPWRLPTEPRDSAGTRDFGPERTRADRGPYPTNWGDPTTRSATPISIV